MNLLMDTPRKIHASSLPELPIHLEDLDEQFIAPDKQPRSAMPARKPSFAATAATPQSATVTPNVTPAAADARATARKPYDAKLLHPGSNHSFSIAVSLFTWIAILGIGAYFWWQLQPQTGLVASGTAIPTLPAATPQLPPGLDKIAAQMPAAPVSIPVAPPEQKVEVAKATVATVPPAPTFASQPTLSMPNPSPAAPLAARPLSDRTSAEEPPIRITTTVQSVPLLLEQAWQAFHDGAIDRAQTDWETHLQADPKNADALHGLAAVALRHQQPQRAADYYFHALTADPKDALALAGLISLTGDATPQQTENRLKTLLSEQPDSPYLNFALGNLFAHDIRWAEAQQAYFKAHTTDPDNPDYLFNLAVSLDQLHQPRLATQYYNQAIKAVTERPTGFDVNQVMERLNILQAEQQR